VKRKIKSEYPKDYIAFDINPIRVKKLAWSRKTIVRFKRYYKSLNLSDVIKGRKEVDHWLTLLKGERGELACIIDVSNRVNRHKANLITELPFSLTVEDMRNWVQLAVKFFKPNLISDSEYKPNKDFERLTETYHSYREFRYKKYSDPAPWASISGSKERLKMRDKKMKQEFDYYKKQGANLKKCLFQVRRWLLNQTIWEGRKGHKSLSDKTIMKICYSKK